jgi:lysyl-tRNA synthetase class 2
MPSPPHDHRPTASLAALRLRARLLAALRRFFDERGFWEVETPLLSHDVCVDAWLDPFIVRDIGTAGGGEAMYLQTSPEFAMKRLLAAGAEAIYQVTRSFRRGEVGRLHNPEFTIIEWYRAGSTIVEQMDLVEQLVRTAVEQSNLGVHARGPLAQPFIRLAYDAAFERFAGRSVLSATCGDLAQLAERHAVSVPPQFSRDDRDAWLNLLLASVVEPRLKDLGGVFVHDYPASQCALARVRADDPPVAERFELYLDGIELCNGYQELTDADELSARMRRQADLRRSHGLSDLPTDSRLIAALRTGLPECAGVALGFDRLALWALGGNSLADVVAFPFETA